MKVVFVNQSSVVSAAELAACVGAMQIQVTRDFAPVWPDASAAQLRVATPSAPASPDEWQMIVGDDSDQLDALGYHEETASGQPLGKVFAKTSQDAGDNWTVTASHELLEMLLDPWACICVQSPDGLFRAYEVADAVEDDQFAYVIDGVSVSNFVLRAWFDGSPGPFDFQKKTTRWGELLAGGYISIFAHGKWYQSTAREASKIAARELIRPGSRRWKRQLGGRQAWRRSVHA